MATLAAELPTLLDMAKRMDPDGSSATLVELLTRTNSFLQDMVWKEGNLPTGHRFTSRTGLPSVGYRNFNEGVPASKSHTAQLTETCGMLEGMSKVDRDLARLNGNEAAFRLSEDMGFLQSMNNAVETGIIYNDTSSTPDRWHGLTSRFASTSAAGGGQIVLHEADDTGSDYTSMWLVGWGPESVYGIYPKGSKQGLETIDMGLVPVRDANNNEFVGYMTNFKWHMGVAVQNYRYVSRIANIDSGSLAGTNDDLIPAMIQAVNKLESRNGVRPVFYANRTVHTYLHLQARNATKNSTLSISMVEGQPVTSFLGIPIRLTDAITNTEDGIA